MKIKKVSAFEDAAGQIWTSEIEALESNIASCINEAGFSSGDSYAEAETKLKLWIKNHKSKVRYLLANIDKITIEE